MVADVMTMAGRDQSPIKKIVIVIKATFKVTYDRSSQAPDAMSARLCSPTAIQAAAAAV